MSKNYRKIWETHNGPIPVDEDGRTYEIHHIDGNRNNNDISNLMCVSIKEHYNIHLKQGEYNAARMIMLRMEVDPKTISMLSSKAAKLKLKEGIHPFQQESTKEASRRSIRRKIARGEFHLSSGEIQRKTNAKLIAQNKHIFQSPEMKMAVSKRNRDMLKSGTHSFQQGFQTKQQRHLVKTGKHHFLTEEHRQRTSEKTLKMVEDGIHPAQQMKFCEFCGKNGMGPGFIYNHYDMCIENPNNLRMSCEHCNKSITPAVYKRYHGDKCKLRFND